MKNTNYRPPRRWWLAKFLPAGMFVILVAALTGSALYIQSARRLAPALASENAVRIQSIELSKIWLNPPDQWMPPKHLRKRWLEVQNLNASSAKHQAVASLMRGQESGESTLASSANSELLQPQPADVQACLQKTCDGDSEETFTIDPKDKLLSENAKQLYAKHLRPILQAAVSGSKEFEEAQRLNLASPEAVLRWRDRLTNDEKAYIAYATTFQLLRVVLSEWHSRVVVEQRMVGILDVLEHPPVKEAWYKLPKFIVNRIPFLFSTRMIERYLKEQQLLSSSLKNYARSEYPGIDDDIALKNLATKLSREMDDVSFLPYISKCQVILAQIKADDYDDAYSPAIRTCTLTTRAWQALQENPIDRDQFLQMFNDSSFTEMLKTSPAIQSYGNPKPDMSTEQALKATDEQCLASFNQSLASLPSELAKKKFLEYQARALEAVLAVVERMDVPEKDNLETKLRNAKFELPETADKLLDSWRVSLLAQVPAQIDPAKALQRTNIGLGYFFGESLLFPDYRTAPLEDLRDVCRSLGPKRVYDSVFRNKQIRIGWRSVRWPEIGLPILAHEYGHIVFNHIFSNSGLQSKNSQSIADLEQPMCVLGSFSSLYRDRADIYWSEDFADHFAGLTMQALQKLTHDTHTPLPFKIKNLACSFIEKNKSRYQIRVPGTNQQLVDENSFDFKLIDPVLDTSEFYTDSHSSNLYRVLRLQISKDGELAPECAKIVQQSGLPLNACQLPEVNETKF